MNRVLLFDTAIATSNLGDELIFECVKEGLHSILDNTSVFRLSTHTENYSALQMLLPNWKAKVLCDEADLKFICGTNLLAKHLWPIFGQWQLNPSNLRLYKDSVLIGVGRGGDFIKPDFYTKFLYKHVLSKKYAHSVRDDGTKVVLEKLGFAAINTGCPTLWKFTPEFCSGISHKKAESVITSVSGYSNQKDVDADRKMLDIIFKNYDKVYAWIQTATDDAYLSELVDDSKLCKKLYSFNAFEDILNKGNVDYIGTRLHGGIFALQHQCRTIIVSIDERAEEFHKSNNIPILNRDEIDSLDSVINSSITTNITVNQNNINVFLSQFGEI